MFRHRVREGIAAETRITAVSTKHRRCLVVTSDPVFEGAAMDVAHHRGGLDECGRVENQRQRNGVRGDHMLFVLQAAARG